MALCSLYFLRYFQIRMYYVIELVNGFLYPFRAVQMYFVFNNYKNLLLLFFNKNQLENINLLE